MSTLDASQHVSDHLELFYVILSAELFEIIMPWKLQKKYVWVFI